MYIASPSQYDRVSRSQRAPSAFGLLVGTRRIELVGVGMVVGFGAIVTIVNGDLPVGEGKSSFKSGRAGKSTQTPIIQNCGGGENVGFGLPGSRLVGATVAPPAPAVTSANGETVGRRSNWLGLSCWQVPNRPEQL